MLVIRQSQMQAFRQAALGQFEDDMVVHLKEFAPKHCEVIGEPAVRNAIKLGIERARKYGLSNRGPVRFYIELMFMYGSDFDTDPQCSWASQVLNDEGFPDQMAKADQLYDKTMTFTDEVAGKDYMYAKNALRRVHQFTFEDLPPLDDAFDTTMFDRLKQIHPEKVRALGETITRAVIVYGKSLPDTLSLAPERGAALCVGSMFALGHGFGHDPLLPWIAHTITNGAIANSQARVKRLHSRIMTYLDHIIAGFDGTRLKPMV
jgi:hypothetical protein